MSKTRILYVEDEPFLGKIVKESLESRDFEVEMVADGAKVMQRFGQFQPDICVLDVMLPNVDGFSLAEQIREQAVATPIIFLTAKIQTEDVLKGFQLGGNDYLKKPFSMEELIVRVENLLSLSQNKTTAPAEREGIVWGNYTFFPHRYELEHPTGIKKLSHRETQLLEILEAHRNRAVERKLILQEVWGDDSFFNSRNLDVYIKKLRDYLKQEEKVQIITLKGVGYHFLVEGRG